MFKKSAPVAPSAPNVLRADQDFPYKTVLEYTDTGKEFDLSSTTADPAPSPHFRWDQAAFRLRPRLITPAHHLASVD